LEMPTTVGLFLASSLFCYAVHNSCREGEKGRAYLKQFGLSGSLDHVRKFLHDGRPVSPSSKAAVWVG